MVNRDDAKGFWPVRHLCGGEMRTNRYLMTSGTRIYAGDLLKIVAGGTVEIGAADIGIAAIGIAAESKYDVSSTATMTIQVYDDPLIVFGCQADSGTAPAATDVGHGVDHVATTGDTVTNRSLNELDSSEMASGSNAQFKIIGIIDTPDNTWGEHADLEVVFNEHFFHAAVAGV